MTERDTRVIMYRAGEDRLFNSAEEIPPNEGWVDHPDKVQAQPVKRGPGRPRKQVEPDAGNNEPDTDDGAIQS